MISKFLRLDFFDKYREYGPFFIRAFIGVFIVWGVQDNVFSYTHMREFAAFLEKGNVPFPLFSAFLSAYAQMICGVSILLGAWIRLTSIIFIINFIAAIIIAHLGDDFRGMFPPLMMIFTGIFFLLHGAGKLSLDEWWEQRRENGSQTEI
jgi:putative oxidoreductase